jgi:hypothetical protein
MRQNAVDPDSFGRGARATQDERVRRKANRVRLVCACTVKGGHRCGKLLDSIVDVDLAYGARFSTSEWRHVEPSATKTWRCQGCGYHHVVPLDRMREEHAAAVAGNQVVVLPLRKR